MRSSLSSKLEPSLLQEMVGSGCPRGGWHSSTAGSPTATMTSTGFCLKSSRKTGKQTERQNSQWSGIQWRLTMIWTWNITILGHIIGTFEVVFIVSTRRALWLMDSVIFTAFENTGVQSCDIQYAVFSMSEPRELLFIIYVPFFSVTYPILVPGMKMKCTKYKMIPTFVMGTMAYCQSPSNGDFNYWTAAYCVLDFRCRKYDLTSSIWRQLNKELFASSVYHIIF